MEISSTTSLPSIQAVPNNSETPTAFSEKLECDTQGTLFVESEIPARDNVPDGPSLEQNLHVPTENSDQPKPIIENIVAESSKSVDSPSSSSSNLSVVQSSDSGSIVTSSNGSSEIHRTVVLESAISAEHSVLDDPTLDQNQYVPTQNSDRLDAKVENILAESSKEDDSPASSSSSGTSVAGLIDGGSIVNLSNGSGEIGASEDKLQILSSDEPRQSHEVVIGVQNQMVGLSAPSRPVKQVVVHRALVDTTAPFESVKEAVTKFGGIVDWKAHKLQTVERRKYVEFELEKAQEEVPKYKKQTEAAESAKVQVLEELDKTKRLIEELKLNLEKAQTEENQAKQDSELAQLRVKEIEQGIADESSVAAKTQLEVAKARHNAAVTELKSVRDELEALKHQHVSLVNVRDLAVKKAEEAVSSSKEVEKTVEELTLELIMAKESLESTQTAHLEAEEHRIAAAMAKEQDEFNWQRELKEAEEEVQKLNEKLESTKELKSKLDSASQLLLNLKAELATYMQSKLAQGTENMEKEDTLREELEEAEKTHTSINAAIALAKQEIEEVRVRIEKAKEDVKCLRVAAVSLKLELEKEKAALMSMRQREGMALVAVASLEAELNEAKSQMELVHIKEKETREKMVELPKALQQAAQEADQAKTLAKLAREERRKAREKAEQVKAGATTMESRLLAALKEIEAAKASERLALAAVKALQESESVAEPDSPGGVTLSLEDYYELSKRAHEAEEHASIRVTAAIAQIGVARESEFRSLNKLKEASREMDERKEALRKATEKAEKAKEGKLGVEQELRKWRADHEKRRKAADAGPGAVNPNRSPRMSFEERKEPKVGDLETAAMQVHQLPSQKVFISGNENVESMPDLKVKRKKRKSLFPRIIMFWARKRAQSK